MTQTVGDRAPVKASGRTRSFEEALAMIKAGATRLDVRQYGHALRSIPGRFVGPVTACTGIGSGRQPAICDGRPSENPSQVEPNEPVGGK